MPTPRDMAIFVLTTTTTTTTMTTTTTTTTTRPITLPLAHARGVINYSTIIPSQGCPLVASLYPVL